MFLDSVDYLNMIVCGGSMFLDSVDYLYMMVVGESMFLDSVDYLYIIVCGGSMLLDLPLHDCMWGINVVGFCGLPLHVLANI